MNLQLSDILIIVVVVLSVALFLLYRHNMKTYRQSLDAQDFINANKMVMSILVIDKKFEKPTATNLPKGVYDKLPNNARRHKMAIVKAKVGPQITTLICDKNVYDAITPKKPVKVEISGMYIVNIVGLKLENKKNKTWKEKVTVFINKNKNKAE